jgi:hypothetical protein
MISERKKVVSACIFGQIFCVWTEGELRLWSEDMAMRVDRTRRRAKVWF